MTKYKKNIGRYKQYNISLYKENIFRYYGKIKVQIFDYMHY